MMRPSGLARRCLVALGLVSIACLAGCRSDPLFQKDSYAAQLYVQRCGQCHTAYAPGSMTAAMWRMQLEAMQPKIAAAGMEPLSSAERAAILGYLTRNAGHK